MRIGIDARLIDETGVGRYIRNLIGELGKQDKTNRYVVFLKRREYDRFSLPNSRWSKVLAEISWHSFTEQFVMPWILLKARLDLVHVPYFNIPIFYPWKLIVTIHDLTILHFDTGKATTLPWLFYLLRRLGYRITLAVGLARAKRIIAVSHATKQELIDHFRLNPENIVVTHEAIDETLNAQSLRLKAKKRLVKEPYFLYVGNAYPHKNLETLLHGYARFISQGTSLRGKEVPLKTKLVLVGKDDFFYQRIQALVHTLALDNRVIFFGQADDASLANLYTHARAFVFPSLMEGFGLPALEAAACGTPVICSDIPAFREILGPLGNYFNPNDVSKLRELLTQPEKLKKPTKEEQHELLKRFNWRHMAENTLRVYKSLV